MAKVTYMPGKRFSGKASYYSNSSKPYPYLSRPTKWVVGTRCFFKSFENNFRLFKVANACKLSLMSSHWLRASLIDDGGGEGKGERTYPPPPCSTTVNWQQVKVNVGLGEGKVGSCPDTYIDPRPVGHLAWSRSVKARHVCTLGGKHKIQRRLFF